MAASGHLHYNKKHIYIEQIFLSIYQYKVIFVRTKLISKLFFLIVSRTSVKLFSYKCAHFLLFLFLSTLFIHQFYSYTKILILIPLIPTPHLKVVFIYKGAFNRVFAVLYCRSCEARKNTGYFSAIYFDYLLYFHIMF